MRVNHNIPALNAWRQGTITQRSMSKTLERLSSGLRINRAADDAAGLAISEKMRAQIRGLDQATRNAQDGISLIQTAEGALNETHSILQRMRELSVQAANDTYTSEDRQEIQKEINQLTSEIDRIAGTTEFNNKKLLDGSTSALVSTDKLSTKVFMRGGLRVLDQFGQKAAGGGNFKLDIEATAGQNEIQKSDIFKIKHESGELDSINTDSNITSFEMTGSPSGEYDVNTVDVGISGTDSSVAYATGGNTLTVTVDSDSQYAGSFANDFSIAFTTGAGTLSASFDEGTKVLTVAGTAGGNEISAIATAISAIDGFTATGSGGPIANNFTSSFASGVDAQAARVDVAGQFQQSTTNGFGLVESASVVSGSTNTNASMYFEVTEVSTSDNTITVNAYSHEYAADGEYQQASKTEITLQTTANNTVTVGNASIVIDTAAKNNFTIGDKFGLELVAAENNGQDQVVISDDNGNTRQWTFADGTFNDDTVNLKSYYVNSETGNVDSSDAEITFSTASFTETPSVENFSATGSHLTAISGDNLEAGTSWTLTETVNTAAAATATAEKQFTASGQDVVSGVSAGTLSANASILLEVVGKAGSSLTVRARSHQVLNDGTTSSTDEYLTFVAGNSGQNIKIDGISDQLTIDFAAASNITVGDKVTIWAQGADTGGNEDTIAFEREYLDSDGNTLSTSSLTRTLGVTTTTNVNGAEVSFFEMDEATGSVQESTLVLTGAAVSNGGITTFTTDNTYAVEYSKGQSIGDVADGDTRLYDTDKFWDASGNFILEEPQTIKLVQGNGEEATFTISGEDTFDDVVEKLNTAIGSGLGQNDIAGASNSDNYASFVTSPDETGFETVEGTFVIRSAIAGKDGEITFVGNDDVLNALSLTTIQESENNTFTVDVTNAHTGDAIATDVQLAKNELTGVVHENVDVEFAANTGIKVSWDASTKNFTLVGGSANAEDTFVHLADRTMVLHIGANQKQDIGTGIGNMGADALGVDNIQVTSNSLANDAIGKIDNAIGRVSGERSKLGAVQNRLDHTINNLGVTMENLTAAESRIRDADMAKEMMEFTKLQILSQSANAMLSQANQLPNNVLQLLR